jgi:hypothetical protein
VRIMPAAVAAVTGCVAAAVAGAAPAVPAGARETAQAPPTPVTPSQGRPFTPVQGDWEGTTRGFGASFQLDFDGSSRYVLTRLVLLRPNACPVEAARHDEFYLRASTRLALGTSGALRLGSTGVTTTLRGARAATLTSPYRVGACAGTLTWRMHPARRVAVDDGRWTIRFGSDTPARFAVASGGRLARAVPLPPVPSGCSGLRGALDLFISASGRAGTTQSGVTVTMRFSRRTATGTLRVAGCPAGSIRISASRPGGS